MNASNIMKRSAIIIAALFLFQIFLPLQTRAQDTSPENPYSGDFWSRSTLTGDWVGCATNWPPKA